MVDTAKARPQWRGVALPVEHGGWSFLVEPILLGLLIAPSFTGLFLSIAACAVFLIHQPLKVTMQDRRNGRVFKRTRLAERFTIAYGTVALVSFILALVTTPHPFWIPLVFAVPFALIQLFYESQRKGREATPEIAGALALAITAPTIAVASGWDVSTAMGLWIVLSLRSATSILYVRSRLRLEKGKEANIALPIGAHIVALVIVLILASVNFLPFLTVVLMVILLARCAHGLSRYRKPVPVKIIGIQELIFGLITVVMTALGYRI